jgi:Fe-S cluster assembly protein SufD
MIKNELPNWLTKIELISDERYPSWLNETRQREWNQFVSEGIPSRVLERWKYSDLSILKKTNFSFANPVDQSQAQRFIQQERMRADDSILLAVVNGFFEPALSDLAKLPDGVIACDLAQACELYPDLVKENWLSYEKHESHPFASLNGSMWQSGLFLYLPDHMKLSAPVHLLSLVIDEAPCIASPRHMLILGATSRLMLLEEHISFAIDSYVVNQCMSVKLQQDAKIEHYKIQRETSKGIHLANTFFQQLKDSHVASTQFTTGAAIARDDIVIKLAEHGAACSTAGFYSVLHDGQYVDYHVDINHHAPHSSSEMLYKGILDQKARAVFNGRLHVKQDAQRITAYQANHNLLLSDTAEIYSKPELEIYADDVKCKHGATTGQLDEDALFFMRSRGIAKEEAMSILLQGFAQEIVERVSHPTIMLRVLEIV